MKRAIVTGGGSGLGYEIAKILIEKDIKVYLAGRTKIKLAIAKERLGDSVEIVPLDIGEEAQVMAFYDGLEEPIDYLFNVAGVGLFGPVEGITRPIIDEVLNANLIGMMLMTKEYLKDAVEGKIINIMSTAGKVGKVNESLYCASKWGARGFTEALKVTYKGSDIKIMGVYPGGMNTAFWDKERSDFMDPEIVARQIVEAATNDDVLVNELVIERP